MDIAAFHADGISPMNIRSWVVADHQYLSTGKACLRQCCIEKSRARLFRAEIGGKVDPIENPIQ